MSKKNGVSVSKVDEPSAQGGNKGYLVDRRRKPDIPTTTTVVNKRGHKRSYVVPENERVVKAVRPKTAVAALDAHPRGRDDAKKYRQRLETALRHCLTQVGDQKMQEFVDNLDTNGPTRLLAWKGVSELIGQTFGRHYASEAYQVAYWILEAHKAHKEDDKRAKTARKAARRDAAEQSAGMPQVALA